MPMFKKMKRYSSLLVLVALEHLVCRYYVVDVPSLVDWLVDWLVGCATMHSMV
jgi:hypothetical protein